MISKWTLNIAMYSLHCLTVLITRKFNSNVILGLQRYDLVLSQGVNSYKFRTPGFLFKKRKVMRAIT